MPLHLRRRRRGEHAAVRPRTAPSGVVEKTKYVFTRRQPAHARAHPLVRVGVGLAGAGSHRRRGSRDFGDWRANTKGAAVAAASAGASLVLVLLVVNPWLQADASTAGRGRSLGEVLDRIALEVSERSTLSGASNNRIVDIHSAVPVATTVPPPPPAPPVTAPPTPAPTVAAPVVTQTTAPAEQSGSWQALVMSLSWNGSLMLKIAQCESGDNPDATQPESGAHGLFQQLGLTTDDPFEQVRDAFALWQSQGYGAWAASESCWG
jgi:hypothetical protein